jgi:hypothetical protein
MGHADYLKLGGDYNAICDRCGSKFKFSQLKLEWDGLYVCTANGCWEPRQPQDYVKGVMDDMSVPVSRPDQPPVYLQDEIVTEQPIITLSFIKALSRIFSVSVSSVASIITNIYPKQSVSKVVDGYALNSTTLG